MKFIVKLIVGLIFLCVFDSTFCQIKTITGRILDANNDEPVYNAVVIIKGTSSGTYTNYLGYFQIEVAKNYHELVVSHVGYETSVINISNENKFKALIKPKKYTLHYINLATFPRVIGKVQENINTTKEENMVESVAYYVPDWNHFYNQLGNLIVSDSSYHKEKFNVDLKFTIDKNADVTNIQVEPDTTTNSRCIINALKNLTSWEPAMQNNLPTAQNFIMNIFFNDSSEKWQMVDQNAMPLGGYAKFYEYVQKTIRYPAMARRMGVEGKVYVQFEVNQDGSLSNVKIVKGIGAGCDQEVVRIISSSPKWSPPKIATTPTKQRIILPITFSLGSQKSFHGNFSDSLALELSDINVTAFGIERPSNNPNFKFKSNNSQLRQHSSFPGGTHELDNYIKKNIPEIKDPVPPNKLNNSVYVELILDKNGNITDVNITKSLGPKFDKEAKRLCSNMPKWKPATLNQENVKDTVDIKICFGKITRAKKNSAEKKLKKGLNFINKGDNDKACVLFSKAIDLNPTNLNYYFNRAAILLKMQKISAACKDLTIIKGRDQEALELYKTYCVK